MTLAKRDWDMIIQSFIKMRGYCPNPLLMAISAVMIPLFVRSVLEDNSATIRQCSWRTIHQRCCHKLSVKAGRDEKHHGQLLRMTPQESDKIAVYLHQKFENDDDLIRVLFLALPDNLQFNFVKKMEKNFLPIFAVGICR